MGTPSAMQDPDGVVSNAIGGLRPDAARNAPGPSVPLQQLLITFGFTG